MQKQDIKPSIKPRAMRKLYALGQKRPIDLSLSENPLGCSPLVSSALKNIKVDFNDYPKPNGFSLKIALADKFKLKSENFFIANGSESIISNIPRVFASADDEVLIPRLTFPMFKICSELAGLKIALIPMTSQMEVDLKKMVASVSNKTKLIFICNPNNPTGSVLAKKAILQLLNNMPKSVTLVIDEANIDFGGESLIDEVEGRKNLIVLRTFSKGFGLANLRIGFAAANREIVQKMEEETPVFQTSGLSETLAEIALSDDDFLISTKKFIEEQRNILRNRLEGLGFTVFPSEANNLFVRLPDSISASDFRKGLEFMGISLVMGSNFDGFDDRFFRVSIRTTEINQAFLKSMEKIVSV